MATPSGSAACNLSTLNSGKEGVGIVLGTAPKREATVATSRCSDTHTRAASATAIRNAGQFGRKRRTSRMVATDSKVMPTVGK